MIQRFYIFLGIAICIYLFYIQAFIINNQLHVVYKGGHNLTPIKQKIPHYPELSKRTERTFTLYYPQNYTWIDGLKNIAYGNQETLLSNGIPTNKIVVTLLQYGYDEAFDEKVCSNIAQQLTEYNVKNYTHSDSFKATFINTKNQHGCEYSYVESNLVHTFRLLQEKKGYAHLVYLTYQSETEPVEIRRLKQSLNAFTIK